MSNDCFGLRGGRRVFKSILGEDGRRAEGVHHRLPLL